MQTKISHTNKWLNWACVCLQFVKLNCLEVFRLFSPFTRQKLRGHKLIGLRFSELPWTKTSKMRTLVAFCSLYLLAHCINSNLDPFMLCSLDKATNTKLCVTQNCTAIKFWVQSHLSHSSVWIKALLWFLPTVHFIPFEQKSTMHTGVRQF